MKPALAAVALAVLAGAAHADPAKPDPDGPATTANPGKPDSLAEDKAKEANLESEAPRQGVTISLSFGPGIIISKGTVGQMPTASLRLGHVATPSTVITLELAAGSFFHSQGSTRLTDTDSSILVGGLHYTNASFWLRGAGGLNIHTIDNGPMGTSVRPGPAALAGAGIDLVRRHFWVLGLEAYGIAAVNHDGVLWTSALMIGIAHY